MIFQLRPEGSGEFSPWRREAGNIDVKTRSRKGFEEFKKLKSQSGGKMSARGGSGRRSH